MENPVIFTLEDVRRINAILIAQGGGPNAAGGPAEELPSDGISRSTPGTMQIPRHILKFSVQEINDAMALAHARVGA